MYRVRTYNKLSSKGLDRFNSENYDVSSDAVDPDAFMLRSQKLHDEEIPMSVKAVARAGAGVNNIPIEKFTEKGIVVFNTPGANANAVKELIASALFISSRDIFGGMNYVQGLTDIKDAGEMSKLLEKQKSQFAGSEVMGKTLGVVGLGAIGSMVANMALELGMNVVGFDPAMSVEAAWRLSHKVEKMDNLQSLLAKADFITLHVPALDVTKHLINAETLTFMKASAVLLNFAREEVVDSSAVRHALDHKNLSKYVTDFPTPELLGRKDVILMPHIGASTEEAEENCAIMAADQLMDYLEQGNVRNSVNFPATKMPKNSGYRITFCNKNVPKILGSVLSLLADCSLNVIDMVNKSRNDVAYNIIDVESEPTQELLKKISNVEGIFSVRLV
ncbi:MAG: phosphoglycerate dehydrogenase [Porticoccus sp.]|jgi:D-3-phosphoglycerate dehydrogenase|uniref:phosphoglycerate dehydrogenase n=1 Tax=Porticoccus sp. Uisw_050_02 TaxID=3230978 RepID=UPI0030B52928|tara:strand:+ start:6293 stop:7462 length:1170 start_codon:yes stop_codon:yes gene_type:complete